MKIGVGNILTYFYSPLFWTLLFILCASFTQTEDVVTKDAPASIQKTLATNLSMEETSQDKKPLDEPEYDTNNDKINANPVLSSHDESEVLPLSSDSKSEENVSHGPNIAEFGMDIASQNSGISNDLGDSGEIPVTFVDIASEELRSHFLKSSQSPQEYETALFNQSTQSEATNITTERAPDEDMANATIPATIIDPKENLTEEIPSFNEWTQKQLEEAEKKREEVNTSSHHQINSKPGNAHKVRSKNYASPDCGAKIVGSNPEAIAPSSVLSPSRDEYKLNTCTSRIWFIVELCEAIQAKKIDLANFELFSSSPKDFSVSVSDRFPSREWSNVGQFTAKDERDVQSFDLHPHLFGKYIKVEMHSHYGSEHFCPISLFRVYGTSEFEVLEKEDQPHAADDDEDDDTLDPEKRPGPKNLFSSATDAVISIVKKAAEVLGNKANTSDNTLSGRSDSSDKSCSTLISTCTSPRHLIVCDNCSDLLFGQVFELLSCKSLQLHTLLTLPLIRTTILNTSLCIPFGIVMNRKVPPLNTELSKYVKSFFPTPYLAAMCNVIAVMENKIVLNVSNQIKVAEGNFGDDNSGLKLKYENIPHGNSEAPMLKIAEAESTDPIDIKSDDPIEKNESANEIQAEDHKVASDEDADVQAKKDNALGDMVQVEESPDKEDSKSAENGHRQHEDGSQTIDSGVPVTEITPDIDVGTESNENLEFDRLMSDLDNGQHTSTNSVTPAPPKESVFLRLSNRIKTLERNMSLSSQYLEELSRRYKKQVEEMVRLLETTIANINEENKKKDERNDKLEAKIKQLAEIVQALVAERDNTFNWFHWFMLLVIGTISIVTFCRRHEHQRIGTLESVAEVHRRKSIDVVNHSSPAKKERRPSEEAVRIAGTYEHLLLDHVEITKRAKERKRKRKRGIQRSISITTLSEEHHQTWPHLQEFHPSATSVQMLHHAGHVTALDDAPIVLEESDNNPLQDMPLPKPLQQENAATGKKGVMPMRKTSSPALLKSEVRKKTKNGFLEIIDRGHKKSASVDESNRQSSPTPSDGNVSLDLTEKSKQKREKKPLLKKFFKKVF